MYGCVFKPHNYVVCIQTLSRRKQNNRVRMTCQVTHDCHIKLFYEECRESALFREICRATWQTDLLIEVPMQVVS
jgi:hypothetical protein